MASEHRMLAHYSHE